jgi:RNA polymerase sigma factor (sigma-70 family)
MTSPLPTLLRRFRRLTEASCVGTLTDAQLLGRFLASRDEAAFEVLVWRHAAMVYGLCRRLLRHEQDAEDAFQATFLALARKAATVRNGEALASWLYKVAYRITLAARAAAGARAEREPIRSDLPARVTEESIWRDLRPVLDEEVNRLPAKYRAAFVLCHLEGRTNEEAARQLGCPKGTVLSRLARARQRLRSRLTRRGVGLAAAVVAVAGPPARLVGAAVDNALSVGGVGAVSVRVAALTEGALRTMSLTKLQIAAGVLLVAGLLGVAAVGNGAFARGREGLPKESVPPVGRGVPQPRLEVPEMDDAVQVAMRRRQSTNNLKQIGEALHAYHDDHRSFPAPAIYDKGGKALLSWRVALLPYLDQKALYQRFRLDEPWDSTHNQKLLKEMPSVYAPVGVPSGEPGRTYYQAFVGPRAGFEPGKKLSLVSFPDGTGETIWIAEAGIPVPWSKPEDLPFLANRPLPKLGGQFGGSFHALKVDGTVLFASKNVEQQVLLAALIRDKLLVKNAFNSAEYDDVERLAKDNERLLRSLIFVRGTMDREKGELIVLEEKLASVSPEADAKTAKLLKERARLQEDYERMLQQLNALRAERERLERMLDKRLGKKE